MTDNREPFVFYTSGSTGEPKIVRKSYECLFNEAIDLAKFFGFSKDIVFVSTVSDWNNIYAYVTKSFRL